MRQKLDIRPITEPTVALASIKESIGILIIAYIPKRRIAERFEKIRERMTDSGKSFKVWAPSPSAPEVKQFFPRAIILTGKSNVLSLAHNVEVSEGGAAVDVDWTFDLIYNLRRKVNAVLLTDDKYHIGNIFGGQLTSPVAEALNAFDKKKLSRLQMGDIPKSHYLDFHKEEFFTF